MCGRYTLTGPARIRSAYPQYDFEEFTEYRLPRFNVAPTQDVLGVLNDASSRIRPLHWGIGERINARAETILRAPIPWRCILFADGFYEWRARKPYYFTLKDDALFAFAAIYEPRLGCAIVTVPANELVAKIHDRMPAILHAPEKRAEWLRPGPIEHETAAALLAPYDANNMNARPASSRLNTAAYDNPDVLIDNDPIQERLF